MCSNTERAGLVSSRTLQPNMYQGPSKISYTSLAPGTCPKKQNVILRNSNQDITLEKTKLADSCTPNEPAKMNAGKGGKNAGVGVCHQRIWAVREWK
jgi:hypothetical protein